MKRYKVSCGLLETIIDNVFSEKSAKEVFIVKYKITRNLYKFLKVEEI